MKMARKPEVSLGMGLATATVVYAVYSRGLPTHADIRAGRPGDDTLEAVRKQNAWMAAAVVGGISLISKDATVFIFGGATLIALDWLTRVNNWTNPITGDVTANPFAVNSPQHPATMEDTATDYAAVTSIR